MEMTVMKEGHPYVDAQGILRKYPAFVPEDYVILKLEQRYQNGDWVKWNQEMPPDSPYEILAEAKEFSGLKKGFRGDLIFRQYPQVIEVSLLLSEQTSDIDMTMKL